MPTATAFGVSAGLLGSLASTRPAVPGARLLHDGLHSRRLVLLKSLLTRMDRHRLPPAVWLRTHQDWELLERAERHDPEAARHALAYPTVGNWLVHALDAPDGDEFSGCLSGFGALAAAVALRAGVSFRTTLATRDGRLTLPGIGVYASRAALVRVVAGPRSMRLTPHPRRNGTVVRPPFARAAGAGWTGLRALPGSAVLLDDVDPYRTPLHGPDHDRSTGRSTGPGNARRFRDWSGRWSAAMTLLGGADPARREEAAALVRCVVPRPPGVTSSATVRSAPWCVLTGLPDTASGLASVLVHEVQHSKLAVIGDLVPLYEPGGPVVHRVGWRDDARPVGGVLQGTYAHLALADLWSRIAFRPGATGPARAAAGRRAARYRDQVGHALAVLRDSGELTRRGEEFTAGMARHHASLRHRRPPVPGGPAGTPESGLTSRRRDVR